MAQINMEAIMMRWYFPQMSFRLSPFAFRLSLLAFLTLIAIPLTSLADCNYYKVGTQCKACPGSLSWAHEQSGPVCWSCLEVCISFSPQKSGHIDHLRALQALAPGSRLVETREGTCLRARMEGDIELLSASGLVFGIDAPPEVVMEIAEANPFAAMAMLALRGHGDGTPTDMRVGKMGFSHIPTVAMVRYAAANGLNAPGLLDLGEQVAEGESIEVEYRTTVLSDGNAELFLDLVWLDASGTSIANDMPGVAVSLGKLKSHSISAATSKVPAKSTAMRRVSSAVLR